MTGNCHLTDKSDVYGFGVTLLELITGKEVIDKTVTNRDPLLIEWVSLTLSVKTFSEHIIMQSEHYVTHFLH